nr:MAG TPA: hypothetical protein [Caudoviricetes sp.]
MPTRHSPFVGTLFCRSSCTTCFQLFSISRVGKLKPPHRRE